MALVRPLPARHLRSLVAFGSHEPERGCPFGRWSHARLQRRSPPMARLGPNSLNGWRQSSSGSSSRPSMRPAQRSSCSLELKSTSSIASADDDSSRTSSSTSAPERGGPGSGGARLASAEASVDDSSLPLMSAPMRSAASAAGPPAPRLASAGYAAGPPRRTSGVVRSATSPPPDVHILHLNAPPGHGGIAPTPPAALPYPASRSGAAHTATEPSFRLRAASSRPSAWRP